MTISLSTGMNTDVCNYMFGSILAMSADDVRLSVILGISVVLLFICFITVYLQSPLMNRSPPPPAHGQGSII